MGEATEHSKPESIPAQEPLDTLVAREWMAKLATPSETAINPSVFSRNNFFLMRPIDSGLLSSSSQKATAQPSRDTIRADTPLPQITYEVLRSTDRETRSFQPELQEFLEAQKPAYDAMVSTTSIDDTEKATSSALAPNSQVDAIFTAFDEFIDERHGIKFRDIARRAHQYGRFATAQAVVITDQQGLQEAS